MEHIKVLSLLAIFKEQLQQCQHRQLVSSVWHVTIVVCTPTELVYYIIILLATFM